MFNHELATLVRAGMPILQSLEILLERMVELSLYTEEHLR